MPTIQELLNAEECRRWHAAEQLTNGQAGGADSGGQEVCDEALPLLRAKRVNCVAIEASGEEHLQGSTDEVG